MLTSFIQVSQMENFVDYKLLIPPSLSLFLSPSLYLAEISRMKDVYVTERLEEMDKNKDGKISLDEYISKS